MGRWTATIRRIRARQSLNSVQVARPCHARWEEMAGDDKVRFCGQCSLHVFNLSAMDVEEAADLIAEKDGRLCVRFYRRHDGTVLTRNCPVGVERWRKRAIAIWTATAGACGAALFGGSVLQFTHTQGMTMGKPMAAPTPPAREDAVQGDISPMVGNLVMPQPVSHQPPNQVMGRIAVRRTPR